MLTISLRVYMTNNKSSFEKEKISFIMERKENNKFNIGDNTVAK
jgi:hypothetical protein